MSDATVPRRCDGETALVTGAGGGIGRAAAEAFLERGAAGVVLIDRTVEALDTTVTALGEAHPDAELLVLEADVGDAAVLATAFEAAIDRMGRIHHVVNNAATQTGQPAYPHVEAASVAEVVGVNVEGVLIGSKIAFDHMTANGGGSITSTASGAGKVPLPSDPLYSATKAAVVMFTRAAAAAFLEGGVRLNAVCPGLVDTPMLHFSVEGRPDLQRALTVAPVLDPSEVAAAIVDLALDPDASGATPSIVAAGP